jgi:7-cyano-7-deazaguanine synthase
VLEHRIVRLPDLRESGDSGVAFDGLPPTYIPMRNAIFYAQAASYALEKGIARIVGGHNKDDTKVFRDARPDFFKRLERAFWASSPASKSRIRIMIPLGNRTKPQVVKLAYRLGVPLELTWSCQLEGATPCWRCDGCRNRIVSFERAGVRDPLRC